MYFFIHTNNELLTSCYELEMINCISMCINEWICIRNSIKEVIDYENEANKREGKQNELWCMRKMQ